MAKAKAAMIPADEKALIGQEISSQESAIYKNELIFSDYNPDDLVGKKGLKIYQKMMSDDQVKACMLIKKIARLSTPWDVKPAEGQENNEVAVQMSDYCRYVLRNMKTSFGPDVKTGDTGISMDTVSFRAGTFENVLMNVLSAMQYGFSLSEKVWKYFDDGPWKGMLGICGIKTREPFNYEFKSDKHGNLLGIVPPGKTNLTDDKLRKDLPPSKFIIYSYNQEFNNWYGTSDLRAAYRSWWSKDMTIKWWNIFNERFGMPTAVAKYPAKGKVSQDALDDLDDALMNLQAKSAVRIPDNFILELLEASRRGEGGYGAAIEFFDKGIARSCLIPNKLGFGDDESGSFALGKKHFDVFIMVLEKLGSDISEQIVNEQIIKPLIVYNFGEIDEDLMPFFTFESLIGEDVEAKARVVQILAGAGLIDKREAWVRDYLNVPERDLDLYPHLTELGEPNAPVFDPNNPLGGGSPGGGNDPKDDDPDPDDKGQRKDNKKKFKDDGTQFTRNLSRFEKKVNFGKFKNAIRVLDSGMKEDLKESIKKVQKDMIKQVSKMFEEGKTRDVKNLKVRGMTDFKKTIRNYLVKIHLDTKLGQLEELQKTDDFDIDINRRFSKVFADQLEIPFEPWEPVDPVEAIDFFNRKVLARVAIKGARKVLLPLGKSAELKYYDDRAFYIQGVEEKYILDQAKNILLTGIEKGWSGMKAQEELNDLFDKYLSSGQIKDGKVLNPSRIETIVRTNTTEAYNRGRAAMFDEPLVADQIPFVMWSAIIDGRQTPYCENMDGKVFRRGEVSPPPAHFNCRSLLVPITQAEVEIDPGSVQTTTQATAEQRVPRPKGFKLLNRMIPNPAWFTDEVTNCLYSTCSSEEVRIRESHATSKTYHCNDCDMDFKVTKTGDLYLWDVGANTYVRVTGDFWPDYF